MKDPKCTICSGRHYQTFCGHKERKPIKAGKHTIRDRAENKKFRESKLNHEGYLICQHCGSWDGSDADHIIKKSIDPSKRYDPTSKQILCRHCHIIKDSGHKNVYF